MEVAVELETNRRLPPGYEVDIGMVSAVVVCRSGIGGGSGGGDGDWLETAARSPTVSPSYPFTPLPRPRTEEVEK